MQKQDKWYLVHPSKENTCKAQNIKQTHKIVAKKEMNFENVYLNFPWIQTDMVVSLDKLLNT